MAGRGAPPTWTPAIVVGGSDYGEADRIVRFLSPDHGRVSALARRARASRKRFGGALDLGNRVEVALRPGRGTLAHADEVRLLDGRLGARADLERLALLAHSCEVCAALAREEHPEPRLFGLLDMAGVLLDGMTGPPGALFRIAVEAKALTFAGFAPVLGACAVCGGAPEEPMGLLRTGEGAAHARCRAGAPASLHFLRAVEGARRRPLRDLIDEPAPPGPTWALAEAIESHLGRELRSRALVGRFAVG